MRYKQLTLGFLQPGSPPLTTPLTTPTGPFVPFDEFTAPEPVAPAETCVYCERPLCGPITEALGKLMHADCERKFYREYTALDHEASDAV